MKLGFVSAILPELSLEEVAAFAAQANYDCIELMCWPKGKAERRYAGVTHVDVQNLEVNAIQDLLSATASRSAASDTTRTCCHPMRAKRKPVWNT